MKKSFEDFNSLDGDDKSTHQTVEGEEKPKTLRKKRSPTHKYKITADSIEESIVKVKKKPGPKKRAKPSTNTNVLLPDEHRERIETIITEKENATLKGIQSLSDYIRAAVEEKLNRDNL